MTHRERHYFSSDLLEVVAEWREALKEAGLLPEGIWRRSEKPRRTD